MYVKGTSSLKPAFNDVISPNPNCGIRSLSPPHPGSWGAEATFPVHICADAWAWGQRALGPWGATKPVFTPTQTGPEKSPPSQPHVVRCPRGLETLTRILRVSVIAYLINMPYMFKLTTQ